MSIAGHVSQRMLAFTLTSEWGEEKRSMRSRLGSKGWVTTQAATQSHSKGAIFLHKLFKRMAGTTRLELATSAVTESLADVTYWN